MSRYKALNEFLGYASTEHERAVYDNAIKKLAQVVEDEIVAMILAGGVPTAAPLRRPISSAISGALA